MSASRFRHTFLIYALLTLTTLLTFYPLVKCEFVNFDDNSYVTQNPNVLGGLTANNVAWAFKTAYFGNWHPITWLSHMLDVEMFGLNSGYHHLTNLLLHICNTCLLFWFLKQATHRRWPSAFVAAFFAIHPLHVESVAWVSERKDLLSTFFGLLSLVAYLQYLHRARRPHRASQPISDAGAVGTPPHTFEPRKSAFFYVLSLVFFALGLMSKAMIVTLPFLMLLLDFWPLKRLPPFKRRESELGPMNVRLTSAALQNSIAPILRLILEKLPFFALAFFFTIISSRALALASESHFESSEVNLIANAFISYMRYIGKTFWPTNLAVFYPRPSTLPALQVAASIAAVVLLSLVALYLARRRPYAFVGWFWFVGTLVPVIGLPFGDHSMADRYTYVPLIGLFIALVWAAADFTSNYTRSIGHLNTAVMTAVILLLGTCAIVSRHQLKYWRTSKDLLEHVLAATGDSAMVHNNLGALLASESDWPGAEKHFVAALRLQPMFPAPKVNLARVLAQQGKTEEAEQALTGLNSAWESEGHRELAEVFLEQMMTNEAIQQYSSAIRLASTNAAMRETFGLLLAAQGRISEATEQFVSLVQLRPDAQSHSHLALSLLIQGKPEEAITHYKEAVRLKPDWPEPLNDLAWLLATYPRAELRNGVQAVELAERACRLTTFKEARFLGTLDAAYAEAGRFPEAITTAEQAKSIALAAGEKSTAEQADERLKFYRSGQPFHQP